MNTDKINSLCGYSDRCYNNHRTLEQAVPSEAKSIKISFRYQIIELDFDDYPELKPLVEKIKDYILKSENKRQNEIKLEILKALGK